MRFRHQYYLDIVKLHTIEPINAVFVINYKSQKKIKYVNWDYRKLYEGSQQICLTTMRIKSMLDFVFISIQKFFMFILIYLRIYF